MNHQVDVHPEDLFDREREGTLSADEKRRLEAHSASCLACALVRSVAPDFASERAGKPEDNALFQRLLSGTLGETATQPLENDRFVARGRRRRSPWAVAAIIMFAATGATASFWSVRRAMVQRSYADALLAAQVAAPPPKANPARAKDERRELPAEPVAELEVPLPIAVEPVKSAPPIVTQPRPKVAEEVLPLPLSADQLFANANDARRRGDSSQAMKLYQELQDEFPGTREERTSRVLLGRLLLDRGADASQALTFFSRYLEESPNGTLAEEARLGRALALKRLGRTTEERQAWQQLLLAHPHSIHAERAQKRLDELR